MARPATTDADAPADPSPRGTRRWVPPAVVLLSLILLVWGVAAVITAGLAYLDLRDARTDYRAAAAQMLAADLAGAREHLEAGIDRAESASTRLHRPQLAALGPLPLVGPNVRAVTALGDASATVGAASATLLDAAHQIVHDDRQAEHGELSLAYVGDLTVPLRDLAETLAVSTDRVLSVDGDGLLGPVARAREDYLELAGPATDQAAVAADVVEVLPRLLGGDAPRRYLVLAASLSELRSSGGLPGSWSVLHAEGGHLNVEEFRDIDVLGAVGADVVPPGEDLTGLHATRGGLREWRNIGLAAHFPSTGEVALRMWEALGGEPLDGVIMVDTVVFDRIAHRAGGLDVPGIGRLEAGEVLPFVSLEAYAAFDDHDERKRVLGDVATASFATAFDLLEDDDVPATATMLHDLAEGGHLRIYTRDDEVQPALERAGVAGALPDQAGELAGVMLDNVAANKVDAFTTRRLDHHVELLPGGETRASIEVRLRNDAPRDGYPRHVLGPWTDRTEAGDNLSLVRFVCSSTCDHLTVGEGVRPSDPEQGLSMAEVSLHIPAGEERRVQHRTRTPDGWRFDGDLLVVDVAHLVQPTLEPSELRVSVGIPEGYAVARLPDGARLEEDQLVWRGEASGLVRLTFHLRSTNEE